MKSIIKSDEYNIIVDGATIRVQNIITTHDKHIDSMMSAAGIVSILPMVQIVMGSSIGTFLRALELSRLPLALRKTSENNGYCTHDILRLPTGNVDEATIATISEKNGIIVGLIYNKDILGNVQFRKMVRLSAMHQIIICNKEDKAKLVKATTCVSALTKIPRDKLTVVEKARSLRVRVNFKSKINLPLYYIFTLDKNNNYALSSVAFDLNANKRG